MASIDKLSIQGIRSFGQDDRDKQVLQFFSPLTLIVGQNGAGKTTIIECLKYATTGDMPPGSRGQNHAFVHDPKVAHETEVRGQVKLGFKDVNDRRVVVCRNVVATQKLKKVEFKTLESTLTRTNSFGEKTNISSKCADLNNEMIGCLGVSKAVLINVIFCHQEDSSWPLSEGKALKAKFDDIFAATRYIKALECIRKLRQEQGGTIREYQAEIKYLKQNKEKAAEIQENLSKSEARLEVTKETIRKLKEQLQPIEEKLNEIDQKENNIFQIEQKMGNLASEKKQMDRNQRELEAKIEHFFQGSTEELRRLYQEHQNRMSDKETALERANNELENLNREIQKCNQDQTNLLMEQGKLEQEAKQHQQSIRKRDSLIQSISRDFDFEGFENVPLSDHQVSRFMETMKRRLENCIEEAKINKRQYEDKESAMQKQIDDLRDTKTKLEHTEKMKKQTIAKNKQELQTIVTDLDRLDTSAQKLVDLEEELTRAERELSEEEKNSNIDQLKEEVRDLQLQKKEKDSKYSKVNKELGLMTLQASTRAELEMLQRDKRTKEEDVKRLKSKHEDEVTHLLGHFPTQHVRSALADYLLKQGRVIKEAERDLQKKRNVLSAKEQQRKMLKDQLSEKEDELKRYEEKMFDVSSSQNFDEELSDLDVSITNLQGEKGALKASQHLFGRYARDLQKTDPRCPLCHRRFDSEQEIQELIEELQSKLRKVPENLIKKENEIEKQEKKKSSMLELKPVKESMKKLAAQDIPDLKSKLSSLNTEIEKLRQEVNDTEDNMSMLQVDESTAKEIEPDALMIDRTQAEVSKLERRIVEKQSKLTGGDSGRTIQQVDAEKKELELELETVNRNLEHKRQAIQEKSEALQDLRSVVNSITHEKLKLSSELQRRQQLEDRKTELISENKECQREIEQSRDQLSPIERRLSNLKEQKREVTEKKELEIERRNADIENIRSQSSNVKSYTREINKYISDGKREALEEGQQNLQDLQQQMKDIEGKKERITNKISKLNKDLNEQKVRERELQDNLQLRKRQEEIEVVERQINDLKEQLGGYDHRTLKSEKKKMLQRQEDFHNQRSRAVTQQIREDNEIKMYKKELQTDMYRDAEEKHRDKMIKLRTTELANSDLDKYYKALDRAIMKYHSMKMEEINKIIRELWRTTYRGNDIDAIEIRSDHEEEGSGASKARRTYHYRVVMVKGDTSLDMRGRCSAGQKVLASLIIRLALAETFCINCGILALDEPTTNLDRENIESLAYALVDIIKSRSRQRNFQLVVITHDEDFVELLGRSEYVEHFYRVQKNADQLSTIRKDSVSSLHTLVS
ncbi:DNA repair protein RAD50.L-like [Ptychodera flava]|uniref:DNA repair protein RAD50.L-like n=1 Tax=Ptychodera flava TaxID=63121 RepID=UPI00396A719F